MYNQFIFLVQIEMDYQKSLISLLVIFKRVITIHMWRIKFYEFFLAKGTESFVERFPCEITFNIALTFENVTQNMLSLR